MRTRLLFFLTTLLALAGCGEYVPPMPTRSPIEARQTERALAGVPALPAVTAPPIDREATIAARRSSAELLLVAPDDPRSLGEPGAPVVMIEYSDFE